MDVPEAKQADFALLAKKQAELDSLLRIDAEHSVNWGAVREYSYSRIEGLDPNWVEPGTLMATTHRCAYAGEQTVLKWCLDNGADIDAKDSLGRTPLHYACMSNWPRCVSLLVARGADVMALTSSRWNPLHTCCHYKKFEAARALLTGATSIHAIIEIDIVNDSGLSAEAMADGEPMQNAISEYKDTLKEQKEWRRREMIKSLPAKERPLTPELC